MTKKNHKLIKKTQATELTTYKISKVPTVTADKEYVVP